MNNDKITEYQINQVKEFVLRECIKVGDFILSSGQKSDYYIDCTPLVTHVMLRSALAKALNAMAMHSLSNKKTHPVISYLGMETRGIPFAMLAANHGGVMFGILRKKEKNHGIMRVIEHTDKFVNAVLFEDIITTGNTIKISLEKAKDRLRVYSIICIANRNDLKDIDGVPIYSMISDNELKGMIQYHKNVYPTQKININTVL